MRWIIPNPDPVKVNALIEQYQVPEIIAQVLINRGLENKNHAKSFFSPDLSNLYDPFLMKNMEGETYGGVFLEECFIQAHQFSIASQQTVLLENVSLRAAKVIGIKAEAIGPVAAEPAGGDGDDDGGGG